MVRDCGSDGEEGAREPEREGASELGIQGKRARGGTDGEEGARERGREGERGSEKLARRHLAANGHLSTDCSCASGVAILHSVPTYPCETVFESTAIICTPSIPSTAFNRNPVTKSLRHRTTLPRCSGINTRLPLVPLAGRTTLRWATSCTLPIRPHPRPCMLASTTRESRPVL